MTTYSHLTTETAAVLEYSKAKRIEFCLTDRWIEYTRAKYVLQQMDAVLRHPRSLRMRNLLVVARSGNGKTSIVEHFAKRHPVVLTSDGDPIASVVRVDMPESPDESEFWSLILSALLISHGEQGSAVTKKRKAKSILQYAQTRVLIIDEFNNLASAGKLTVHLLGAIRGLSNDLRMSIIGAGTQAAINALNLDPHMKSRFDPCPLYRWSWDSEYLRFLASYERLLPLAEPSGLASRELGTKIYAMGGETIGDTVRLLKAAAVKAIELGKERITNDVLDAADWIKPSEWDSVARSI